MNKQGQVVRWEAGRGFGFIRTPGNSMDVFFHIRDYRGPGAPTEGMAVAYEEIHVGGKGPRAMAVRGLSGQRPLAARAPRVNHQRPASYPGANDPWLGWAMLLAFACGVLMLALVQGRRLPLSVPLAGLVLNGLTFWLYWRDKYAAQKRAWRTPESTLHLLSLIGGWPAARLAQQVLRHKSAKVSFQRMYWLTVWLNVAVLLAWAWPKLSAWAGLD